MELVNKVLQGYVEGELKDIAPSTRQDNVFLSTNQEKTIEDGLISVYTHTRSGTVNEFTGTGPNGRALMTADIEAGDTFTVNGQPVTAYMGTDQADSTMAGSPWNGKWITFTFDGALNFKGGGRKGVYCGFSAAHININTSEYSSAIVQSSIENEVDNTFGEEYFEPTFKNTGEPLAFKCLKTGDYYVTLVSLPRNGTSGTAYTQLEVNGVPVFNTEGAKQVPLYGMPGLNSKTQLTSLKETDVITISGKGTGNIGTMVVMCHMTLI